MYVARGVRTAHYYYRTSTAVTDTGFSGVALRMAVELIRQSCPQARGTVFGLVLHYKPGAGTCYVPRRVDYTHASGCYCT